MKWFSPWSHLPRFDMMDGEGLKSEAPPAYTAMGRGALVYGWLRMNDTYRIHDYDKNGKRNEKTTIDEVQLPKFNESVI